MITIKIRAKTCFLLAGTAFLLFLAIYYWSTIAGFIGMVFHAAGALLVGCVIAYVVNIPMSFYERHYFPKKRGTKLVDKSRRPVCMFAAIATILGLLVLIIWLVIPELVGCVRLLIDEVPPALENLTAWVREKEIFTTATMESLLNSLSTVNWQEKVEQLVKVLLEGVGGAAQIAVSAVSSLATVVTDAVIGIIFAVYLLAGKEKLASQFGRLMNRFLPGRFVRKLRYVLATFNDSFHRFIVGQCTEAVILGVLCMLGMWILRFPYAVMIGTLIGFTALIPIAGAYIGAGVGAFMILTVEPIKALWFLIFIVVLQQLEGNLIYPKVVGTSIGLPGVWVLAAITIGGGVLGIGGMLLGVPLVAAVYQLLRQELNKTPGEPVPAKVRPVRKSGGPRD